MRPLIKILSRTTPLEGSYNTLFAATSQEAVTDAGNFFMPVGQLEAKAASFITDTAGNDALWELGNRQMHQLLD